MINTWRHHYIPVFYLKQFTSDQGGFKIYDIKKDEFIWGGNDFPPKSYFFKKNDNSVFVGTENQEILEDFFGKREDIVARLFQRINKFENDEKHGIAESDIPEILLFISMLYYRNPNHYTSLLEMMKSRPLSDFGFKTDDGMLSSETENTLKKSVEFQKSFKWFYPTIDLLTTMSQEKSDYISSYPVDLPKLCSDNPVIIRDGAENGVFSSDIVFPISPTRVYVRMKDKKVGYLSATRIIIDMIIFMQAYDYVSCTDIEYVNQIKSTIKEEGYTLKSLKKLLFEMLEDPSVH